ncbi:hypothetical protein CAI21_14335 [Alkalilimnicola ehrlichii]|uniref:Anti-FecI sigma factor, FecR n=1 Tax=Alkalilimnicola ehrlichii TaxID=351052 RepID=A0A3E0WMD0_9GAMM|nr:FecR domain-containing protein [Alkalilimnicola ehrlichii]RFA27785.1 hypothetical protein CAI21_14335 [Alkalilimnicola ehrlichii]RFA33569.1 hypothetical protein CAL65_17090 [Alkalilimnicola ehrlichii]
MASTAGAPNTQADIPEPVLERAIAWAVTLNSGTASAADRAAFAEWLALAAVHRCAWQRIQAVEQEFAGIRPLGESAHRTLRGSTRRRRRGVLAGGLCSFVLLFFTLFLLPMPQLQQEYVTAAGERRTLDLPGGARVYLDGGTVLTVELGEAPTLRLRRGELFVDSGLAQAADKPRVWTADGVATPLGTRFTVTKRAAGTEIAVTEGDVLLATATGESLATARVGERWRLADGVAVAVANNGLRPGAWREGIIEADDAPLGEVLEALARHRRGWLHYDAEAAALRVSGVFRLDDADGALVVLEGTLPVRVERRTPWWVSVRHK